jgi:hypothetical protein
MSVKDMLRSMDSVEYSRWMAFERAHGPIGGEWDAEAISSIQEQLQQISYLLGQAHFTDKTHKRGPIPKPERYPRPSEVIKSPRSLVDIDIDESEWLPPTEDEALEVRIDPEESGAEEE